MKIPRQVMAFCPTCGKHVLHKVSQMSKGSSRSLSWGQRQFARVMAGYGGQPRSEQREFAKTTKKISLVLKCTSCGRKQSRRGFRAKKIKWVG